ncbi:DUF499 domain-containing protein [Skermania piniformis]|uniref:DUF499 domain-containing protein n=1 Tax=Skermania pinensis TaxID=39122 RepID=A0ABX8S4C5_9ACTN|nr:DUF499 domain-containing protein [Skermania piniformis]QXQ12685.1 DUF499 domain-containing protein [Skermania piniformis]
MAQSNRDRVDRAFQLIAPALDTFLDRVLGPDLPPGTDWTVLLEAKENAPGRTFSRFDPQNSLKVIANNATHAYRRGWYPFRKHLSRAEESWATELIDVRNKHAHHDPFNGDDAYRALDTAERFLRAIGAPTGADEVKALRVDLRRVSLDQEDRRVAKVAGVTTVGSDNLPPWREVLSPHPDVASGNFHAAEFAANLANVARGEGDPEYADPVEFFRRTYLTGGLRDLITRMAKRMTGDRNASPVINLQTNFGGGKTHSMLALWHLASGRPLIEYPQELQELLAGIDLDSVRGRIQRVALVGNDIPPAEPRLEAGGVELNTLWGRLAWGLGGADAYELVAESDRAGTNPGSTLRELFELYTPAIILVDEWVAYARQLYDRDNLPAGTFDTQFTFAQTLTEAAATVPGIQVVISIPASDDATDDTGASDEEVGGEYGREALRRLQNVVRRTADQWRSANSEESFEIVRRRLFVPPDGGALGKISTTANAVVKFYRQHETQFPREVREPAYIDRIKRAYPVHPELFDRLYEDWSTLDRFQRTRGVLRLMNTIVGELWRAGDAAPLILPGTVPLDTDPVLTELTGYLSDQWKAIIDADVDGANSTPVQVDNGNPELFGKRRVARRLARTVFLGATPTLDTAHKGVDKSRIFLGAAIPGDVPGNFHAALDNLANTSTYLYSDGPRYWFDTQANTTRAARDYAEQLQVDDVWHEIEQRLRQHRGTSADGFVAVHAAPSDSGDVPDTQEARLVIVPPGHPHDRKRKDDSAAIGWARAVLEHRGSAARAYRNTLCFLAADHARSAELEAAAREYLAWNYVVDNVVPLDLKPQQKAQAEERKRRADETVRARLLDTYTWLIYPEQGPDQPHPVLSAIKAEGTTQNLAERAAKRAREQNQLVLTRAARLIRFDLDEHLSSIWLRDGQISVGELWTLYTTYTYLARLRDRAVLDAGVLSVVEQLLWEQEGFGIADGWDGEQYVGLVLPTDNDDVPYITDSTLLIEPARARAQRDREIDEYGDAGRGEPDDDAPTSGTGSGHGGGGEPAGPRPKTRYFGVAALDPDRYAADFSKIAGEVLQHLAAQPGVALEVRLEIGATAPAGFDDGRIRTVSENATTLKFDQSGFEES